MRVLFILVLMLCMFSLCSCAQSQTDSNNDINDVEVDSFYFEKETCKIGTLTNTSKKNLHVKVYSYELGSITQPCEDVYEIIVKTDESGELKYHPTTGFSNGDTILIEINDWKGAGWIYENYNQECTSDVDGIWFKYDYSYSNFVRDKESDELVPFILDEIKITVTENEDVSIEVVPYTSEL